MRRIAPWVAGGVGLAIVLANLVLAALLLARPAGTVRGEDPQGLASLARDVAALRRESAAVRSDLAAVRSRLDKIPSGPGLAAEDEPDGQEEPEPPPGRIVVTFDGGLEGWATPDWGSGSVLATARPGTFRRGGGALALGYVYGERPPAAEGRVEIGGETRLVYVGVMTTARTVRLAVGVVEESGARYEVRLPLLGPDEGWRFVSVSPAAMALAPGSDDADRALDRRRIRAVYVVDRTKAEGGGNVLFIDDVSVDASKE